MTVSSTTNKVSYSGNGTTTVFAYTFKIFADGDLDVYIRSSTGTETLKTLTTDYTVSNAGVDGGGNVTFVTAPASGETVVIQRKLALTQGTDYVENDPFPAESHEEALDRLTFITQQMQEEIDRSIKASVTNTISSTEFTIAAADRANKIFAFDGSGDLSVTQELGTYQGDWAASTTYAARDIVKDTSTNNIFLANTAHTSSGSQPLTTNTDSAKWDLLVDAASATTAQTAAAASAAAASTSETNAAASESAASASETAAAASETAAAASETAAAASQSAASTSETNAAASESAASASQTAAAASETAAAASETAAAASETAAAASESAAATSESNASASASAAASSASAAEAAAAAVFWEYDTSTSMADPGTGNVRFNNATIASVTQIAVSASSASTGNPDVSDYITVWDDSTSPTKGYIVIRESGAPSTVIVFGVSGSITDNTTWLQIPVAHVSSSGTLSASDDLYFSFSRTGDAGSGTGDLLAANNLSDLDNAATARTNLGLVIGTDVQAYDAGLAYLDGLNFTNEATFKAGVNLEIGQDVQAYDANNAVLNTDQTFSGDISFTGTSKVQQTKEKVTISATAATGTIAYDALTQSVLYYTTNASGNWTLNVRGDGSTSLDSIMSTGETLTVVFLVTQGSTAYYQSAFQVDGSSVTPKWQGGDAPTAGTASGIDAYTISIVKTGSATFTALASVVDFS